MPGVAVNPTILRWARETAGLSQEDAARALQINGKRDLSGAQRLAQLENGTEKPSRPLLVRMAKKYRRPLLVFYLRNPPGKGERGEDFRTLPNTVTEKENASVDALVREVKARQGIVRSVVEDEEESQPLDFIGSMAMSDGVKRVAEQIQNRLDFELDRFREQRDPNDAFTYLRACAESAGIFVLLIGDLGSYHTEFSTTVFRGFALADTIAPFVVVNDRDAHSAWSFTLLHELAHLWLGQTGISGARATKAIEQFCNDVAAQILLPADDVAALSVPDDLTLVQAAERVSTFARQRNVSRRMVAYRLFRSGLIQENRWIALSDRFHAEWLESRRREKAKAKQKNGGPNWYVVKRHRIGNGLLNLVSRALSSRYLSTTKAAQVLGVKPGAVHELLQPR